MTRDYRKEVLDHIDRIYFQSTKQEVLDSIIKTVKSTTDPIKLRQFWLKVCKPYGSTVLLTGEEIIFEPNKEKPIREMTFEQIKERFDSPS